MTYRVRFAPVFSSVCALLCATSAPEFARAAQIPSRDAALGAYFDADASSTEIEVELIRLARTRVLVAGGASVPAAVASALCAARGRGVDVRVVLDRTGRATKYSGAAFLASAGVSVALSERVSNAHGPFVVVDDAVVLGTASFAQTRDARGAGNFNVFYRAPQLAQSYATEFWRLYGLARR
ncbi:MULTISPECIES: phospholipase D-like domain-containing protein [Burkholderia]|uniref:phospholipase D-like domain-containing protein n=1 Tax=Burkholderia TaxID=32008 RepID=UPI0009EACC1A|nr:MULTISPECIES: phospholipase D-like domain-containing protein [Burkholderia]